MEETPPPARDGFLQNTRYISPIQRSDSPSHLMVSGGLVDSSRGTVQESGIEVTLTPSPASFTSGSKRPRSSIENAAMSRIDMLTQELEAARIAHEQTHSKHELAMAAKDNELAKLKRQLKMTMDEEEKMRSKVDILNEESTDLQRAYQELRADLEQQLRTATDEIASCKERIEELETERNHTAHEANTIIENLRDELDEANSKLDKEDDSGQDDDENDASSSSPAMASEIRLLQMQLDEQTILASNAQKALEEAQQTLHDASELRALRQKVADLEQASKRDRDEMQGLRVHAKNQEVLAEQLTTLQRLLDASEKRASEKTEIHVAYEALLENEREWKELFRPLLTDPKNGLDPHLVETHPTKAVSELFIARQSDFEALLLQRGQLELQMTKLNSRLEAATKEVLAWEAKYAQLEAELTDAKYHVREMDKEVRVGARTRETNLDLTSLLSSYERGETTEARQLVQQLKEALARSETVNAELQQEQRVMASPALMEKQQGRIAHLERSISDEKAENLRLTKAIVKLETDVALFEKRLGRGEFNPRTTKVVHMMLNPTSHHVLQTAPESADVVALREENERLKETLQQVTHQTPRAKPPASAASITTPHETVEGLRILNQRLKEVFRDQINKYRDAVYRVTGYKIDLKKNELSLRSMYAENEGDEIKFRLVDEENMALLETDFCASLDPKYLGYLSHCNSPPAFVSTVTLNLFEKQTFQPK
ncbi:hypothetical protein SPRG_06144 [Saprolegnia parasitica CBS 223.65]|uniref:Spindle assembly checkpoint component MAD1 n=1 Tax=Saprolegnia parasitica (strain CBS 223.65) TaxID=695850 RepID=A0A067CEB1_SAPPC|nr:hypothetical protein SPRG_06144 [Saprolegnia parasitica CBS 223.65]KDO29089.1 hypothetical protein SPRG_06144 [Saprolegnia parasitica CBS 223.65]|eukprot:XP_012200257.1 hypothetical protein SPRG_06144 [Saprolegnia parasitica CBS 223.65]